MHALRGVDATLYVRFLRGCCKPFSCMCPLRFTHYVHSLVGITALAVDIPHPIPNSRSVLKRRGSAQVYDPCFYLLPG